MANETPDSDPDHPDPADCSRVGHGIVWNATLDNGGLLIGEEVEIIIDLELIKQAS